MRIRRMNPLFLLAILLGASHCAAASPMTDSALDNWESNRADPLAFLPMVPAPAAAATPLTASMVPASAAAPLATAAVPPEPKTGRLRHLLADFAMNLRDIRYRRGGKAPETGFDCSGFVRYVFRHTVGKDLPGNSASQFQVGTKVARADTRVGDLVFFRIKGKHISHVGIYLGEGRFIHAPSSGKSVSVSALSETYWAKRFAGAKRPSELS